MISAAEARKLSKHVWVAQLEQIERGIKETVIMGGHSICAVNCPGRAGIFAKLTIPTTVFNDGQFAL